MRVSRDVAADEIRKACSTVGAATAELDRGWRALEESERIVAWRLTQLVRAGYDDESAVELALADVDLHSAVDLLERGCPQQAALRILL